MFFTFYAYFINYSVFICNFNTFIRIRSQIKIKLTEKANCYIIKKAII